MMLMYIFHCFADSTYVHVYLGKELINCLLNQCWYVKNDLPLLRTEVHVVTHNYSITPYIYKVYEFIARFVAVCIFRITSFGSVLLIQAPPMHSSPL